MVLSEVPLDRRQDADEVFLADLHRSADALVRSGVGGESLDVAPAAEDETRAGRPAQPLASAEQHEIGAGLAKGPQAFDRRQLRRRVDDHGDVTGVRDVGHCLERERARGEVRPGHVQDARRPRADRTQQVGLGRSACGTDLDEPPARELDRRVVRDPVGGLDEEVAREPVELVGPDDALVHVARHAHDRRQEQARGRSTGYERGLVPRQLRDPTTHCVLQLVQIHEAFRGLPHRLDDWRRHDRPTEVGHRRRTVDDRLDADAPVDVASFRAMAGQVLEHRGRTSWKSPESSDRQLRSRLGVAG